MMSFFIVYLVVCLSLTYAWSDTDISVPLRNQIAKVPYIRNALLCHECSSFWFSLLVSFFMNPLELHCEKWVSNVLLAFCGFFINLLFVRNKLIPYKE